MSSHIHTNFKTTLIVGTLLLSFGCSESSNSKKANTGEFRNPGVIEPGRTTGTVDVDPAVNAQGFYKVDFSPVNGSLTEGVAGLAELAVRGDLFDVNVKVAGVEAYSSHAQYIHAGTTCPDINSDLNADEHIDSEEAAAASGKLLIPMDGDLSAQMLDSNVFPAAGGTGKYSYQNSTSLALMISDLKAEDLNPEDSYSKLAVGEALNLEGRVVIVYGIPASVKVPSTVRPFNGLSRQASMPIACGKIVRVTEEEVSF